MAKKEEKRPKLIIDIFKETKLWIHFEKKADSEKISTVEYLINYALPILDRINETFPTYTLHNGQHQLNLFNRIDDILGERLKELNDLEAALLILSIFYHDIGMAYTEKERDNLKNEEEFKEFLNQYPDVQLELLNTGLLSKDNAERYCRWCHAKRVWVYLDKVDTKLEWEGNNIRKELGELCLSHNEPTDYLKDEDKFETNFWSKADLKFCAIILRLSDILDFDNTRTPDSVFEYLKLDNPQTKREKVSHDEWKKHLASKGFFFNDWNKKTPYDINFNAAPNHPAVENDIREFLDTIELELQRCSIILRYCSKRWQNFVLPEKIRRNNIRSKGYKFGNYKFSLDQQQILDLLMGENLYDNPYVFIREVLQNSIDTSRDREFHEHKKGNKNFKAKPIEVSTWIDNDGYRWFRIEDYGMGMDENIINKYFLKVGNSYYNSDEFKVRKHGYKQSDGIDFTPISRFGIGILSCFIAGDLVEVNTKSINCNAKDINPIRLSLKGLHNFYIMQTNKDSPLPMPIENGTENGYRKDFGTSLAIRFRIDKDILDFKLEALLKKILLNPPVDVILKDVGKIGDYSVAIEKPWFKNQIIVLPEDYKKKIENHIDAKISSDIKIHLYSIDLTNLAICDELKGQIGLVLLEIEQIEYKLIEPEDYFYDSGPRFRFEYSLENVYKRSESILLSLQIIRDNSKFLHPGNEIEFDLTSLIKKFFKNNSEILFQFPHRSLIISHNGVQIPNKYEISDDSTTSIELNINFPDNYLISFQLGVIDLKDFLRPGVSIARNKITSISYELCSYINLAIMRALNKSKNLKSLDLMPSFITLKNFSLGKITAGDLIMNKLICESNYWFNENIIESTNGFISIQKILASKKEHEIKISFSYLISQSRDYSKFEELLEGALLQKHCSIIVKCYTDENKENLIKKIYASKKDNKLSHKNLNYFTPLYFVNYYNFEGLIPSNNFKGFFPNNLLNIEHPYSLWLLKSGQLLSNNYTMYFKILCNANDIEIINNALKKLKAILPDEFKPPKGLILNKKDFEVDLSGLKVNKQSDSFPF